MRVVTEEPGATRAILRRGRAMDRIRRLIEAAQAAGLAVGKQRTQLARSATKVEDVPTRDFRNVEAFV